MCLRGLDILGMTVCMNGRVIVMVHVRRLQNIVVLMDIVAWPVLVRHQAHRDAVYPQKTDIVYRVAGMVVMRVIMVHPCVPVVHWFQIHIMMILKPSQCMEQLLHQIIW